MFLAHLPAGYLLGRALRRRLRLSALPGIELLAAVLPDFDLAWFYLVDARRTLHHEYWPHLPWCWLLLAAAWVVVARVTRSDRWRAAGWLVLPNVFGHLLLDSVVGKIDWLSPISSQGYALFEVPARFSPWVANFVLHWSFALELAIVAWAAWVWIGERRGSQARPAAGTAGGAEQVRFIAPRGGTGTRPLSTPAGVARCRGTGAAADPARRPRR